MPRLSLSMIIKNEEKFLEGCLESVKGLVDEIVIVDTGSTDGSRKIAESFGAKVIDFPWIGDFSAARNVSLEHCSGDWVLYLDADERLKDGQFDQVRQLIGEQNTAAFNVIIENPHSLHQGDFKQENSYPRLFRKRAGICFEGKVHEQLWPSLMRQKCVIKQSRLVIQHLGYGQGYDVVKQKAERNLELLRKQLSENPEDAYAQFQIGNSLVVLQRYDEARPVLELALANKRLDVSNRASCYNLLAETEVRRGNLRNAEQYCCESLKCGGKQLMAHWFLALIYFDLQEFTKAIDMLHKIQQLLALHPSKRANQIASDLDIKSVDLHKRVAITYEAAGQWMEAMGAYASILLNDDRQSHEALQGFVRCVERVDGSTAILKLLNAVAESTDFQDELLLPFAQQYRKLNDYASAIRFVDAATIAQPDNAEVFALSARWKMELNDLSGAHDTLQRARQHNLSAFALHKCALELALREGDVNSAFSHLEQMTQTTSADLSPIKNRLTALAAKMSMSPISSSTPSK